MGVTTMALTHTANSKANSKHFIIEIISCAVENDNYGHHHLLIYKAYLYLKKARSVDSVVLYEDKKSGWKSVSNGCRKASIEFELNRCYRNFYHVPHTYNTLPYSTFRLSLVVCCCFFFFFSQTLHIFFLFFLAVYVMNCFLIIFVCMPLGKKQTTITITPQEKYECVKSILPCNV
jgi:hypothetical protein